METQLCYLSEEAIRKHILNPSSTEKVAIQVASIILKTVASTQMFKIWRQKYQHKHAPTIQDLHAIEDADFALRHFKATFKGSSPCSVLKDDLDCLQGIPVNVLSNAQKTIMAGGDLITTLRSIAGKQFDQAEKDQGNTRATTLLQNLAFPFALKLCRIENTLKDICPSTALSKQILAELNFITVVEVHELEALLLRIKGGLQVDAKELAYTKSKVFSDRQVILFADLEKRYIKVISKLNQVPDHSLKEELLLLFEAERANWAGMAARAKIWQHRVKRKWKK